MATVIAVSLAILVVALFSLPAFRALRGDRRLPEALGPGRVIPDFEAVDEDGKQVSTRDLRGRPTVLLFVRGNWCPFCSRQVADLARHYQRINQLGARLVFVTPRPLETTRRVADIFGVDFEFWLDDDLVASRRLGLALDGGVPERHRGEYGKDTLWPASLVLDRDGIIRYAAMSRRIADRPDPQKFVRALEAIGDGT